MFTQAIMDYTLNRNVQGSVGNRDIHGRAPCGVYPAKSPGTSETMDDRWIALHFENDAQWASLREAMGNPTWAADARFATNAGRAEHHTEIDGHLAEWTREQDDYALMHLLQGKGIAAAPVLEASRMFDDPHLRSRTFFREQVIEKGETFEFVGPIWNMAGTPVEFLRGPVGMGADNEYVYRDLLKTSDADYERYRELGWITMDFDSSVP
jgi:benzylsuccinate CoA-transferase BbsF subunit